MSIKALCLSALLPAASFAQSCPSAVTVPLSVIDHHLEVDVSVNHRPAHMMLDTGAGVTALTPDAAYRLGVQRDFDHSMDLGGAGATDNHVDMAHQIAMEWGGQAFTLPVVAIAGLKVPSRQLDGLLGGDALAHFDVDFDLPGHQLRLSPAGRCAAPDWTDRAVEVPVDIDSRLHAIFVPVTVEQSRLTLLLDTGAQALALNRRAAARAGGDAALAGQTGQGTGVNNHKFGATGYVFQDVAFAGSLLHLVPAMIVANTEFTHDGLLGLYPILEGKHFWVSYTGQKLFVAK